MKLLLAALLTCMSLSLLNAQNCQGYYYMNSKEVQMTMLDKKGKESGTLTYTISDVKTNSGTTSAMFNSVMVDEKGKEISRGSGIYKCKGGQLFVDARVAMPNDQMAGGKDMDVKADEAFIEYPASLSDGQSLKDATFKMETSKKGQPFSTVTFDATNRKVTGKESVTTPAGTWECFKISYDGKVKALMAPMNIGIPFNFQCTEWFAPGFGVVKSETYNKNGKLIGSMSITSVKK